MKQSAILKRFKAGIVFLSQIYQFDTFFKAPECGFIEMFLLQDGVQYNFSLSLLHSSVLYMNTNTSLCAFFQVIG